MRMCMLVHAGCVCVCQPCRWNEKQWAFKLYVPAECKSEGLHVFRPSYTACLTRTHLSPTLADRPCILYHGSEILL